MLKNEAIQAMHAGKKVTHRYFISDEWVTIDNGEILLEDGYRCSEEEFWDSRTTSFWDTDWEIFNS
jgi:hypothetical protein